MIIESKILQNFINKASVAGVIDEIRLDFGKIGLTLIEFDRAQLYMSKSSLKKSAFKTYEEIGEIAINNVKRFLGFLKRFNGEVSIVKEGVTLKLKGKTKSAEYILASVDSMPPKKEFPKFEDWKVSIDVGADILKESMANSSTIGKDIDISFESGDKCLLISTGTDDKFIEKIENNTITEKDVKTKFGQPLKDVLNVLEDNVNVSFAHNGPMKIIEKKEMEEYVYFVAPKVDVEEE